MARSTHLKLATQPADDRIAGWRAALGADYAQSDIELLGRVLEWISPRAAEHALHGGEPLLPHAVNTALMLREFKLDAECLAASLLAHVAVTHEAVLAIRDQFGARVAELAEGVARMAMIESLSRSAARGSEQHHRQGEHAHGPKPTR